MTQKLLAAVSKDRKIIANTFSNNQLFDQLIYHLHKKHFNHWHILMPQNQRFTLKMKQCHQTRVHSLGNDKISIQSEIGNSATTQ